MKSRSGRSNPALNQVRRVREIAASSRSDGVGTGLLAKTFLLALLCLGSSFAQVPQVGERLSSGGLAPTERWTPTGGYHALRQELEQIFPRLQFAGEKRDALFLLMSSTFEDQEYEDAYQWSSEFLREYPNDGERHTALFIRGVSAFQTKRLNEAFTALNAFLSEADGHPRRGAAYFWRAMGELDHGDWQSAEADVRHVYEDPKAWMYHDVALMGYALSLERRGEYQKAIDLLEEFLKKFPESELVQDVNIRLASLYLRIGRPEFTVRFLREVRPNARQEQEYTLLGAESNLQLGRYAEAQSEYGKFVEDFADSRYARLARYGLVWSHLKRRDFAGAQREFDSLGRGKDSLAIDALYQSGVLALLQDRPNDALARFDTLTEHSPYDRFAEKAYVQMGMVHFRHCRYREARRAFQLAARLFPESPQRPSSYRMLGEASVALGDFSNAQYAFAQVRRLNGTPEILAPSMFQEGISLYHLGRFKSSTEIFSEYLRKFPNHDNAAEGYVWKGEALYQDYRFDEAERAFADAIRSFPNNPKRSEAVYGLAWSLFEQKKFAQAADAFERFKRDFPGDRRALEASLRQADCYFFMGQYDRAQQMYAELASAKADPAKRDNVEYAAFQIAMSYIQRGESQRGIDELRSFLNRFPTSIYNEVVQFNIGWEYFSKEQYADALREFHTVLQRYPYSQLIPRVLFNIGDAFYNIRQYDSSRVYYQRVIKEYPNSLLVPDALNGLQFSYEAEGRPAGALAEIDTLLTQRAVSTPQEELLLRKGDILFGQGDYAGAVREYQTVLSMKRSPAERDGAKGAHRNVQAKALRQLGRAYEMENNSEQAIRFYRRVVDEFSDTEVAPQTALALGIAYVKARQFRDAVNILENFERKYPQSPLLSEVQYNYGVALAGLPDANAALAQFQLVIQQHLNESIYDPVGSHRPTDVFADRSRLRIAELLSSRKDYRSAVDTLTSVVTRRADDIAAEALYQIGQSYIVMKRNVDALQAFTDLIRQFADFPYWVDRAKIGQGDAYLKLQQRAQAREAYAEAAKSDNPDVRKEAQEKLKKIRR